MPTPDSPYLSLHRVCQRICFAPLEFALLPLFLGCGAEVTQGVTTTVRDSTGVTIVENQGPVQQMGSEWVISSEPTLVIGSIDGPEVSQLYRVRGALRLPDGRVAVGNAGTNEIRIFGPDGGHLMNLGGDGEGPGEFSYVSLVGLLGDSLVVLDRRLRRVSLIHPDEGFVRSFVLEESVGGYPMDAWVFKSGGMLVQDLPLDDAMLGDGFHRNPLPLRACDMAGALQADLGGWPGAEQVIITRETDHGLATMLNSVPFGKSPQISVAGDRMYFAAGDTYEIGSYGSDGTLHRIVRLDRSPVPVGETELSAFIDQELEGLDENEARARRRELEEMPRMDFHPAHGAIMADAEGNLFVEEHQLPGAGPPLVNVFDPAGWLTGHFRLPADLQLLEIGEDYLLGLVLDDMEVEYVYLYRLERPA